MFERIMQASKPESKPPARLMLEIEQKLRSLFEQMADYAPKRGAGASGPVNRPEPAVLAGEVRRKLETVLRLPEIHKKMSARMGTARPQESPGPDTTRASGKADRIKALIGRSQDFAALLSWLFLHPLGKVNGNGDTDQLGRSLIDQLLLGKATFFAMTEMGIDTESAHTAVFTAKIMTTHQHWFEMDKKHPNPAYGILERLLRDLEVQSYLGENRYQGVLWYNAERFERLLTWLRTVALIQLGAGEPGRPAVDPVWALKTLDILERGAESSGYRVEKLLDEVMSLGRGDRKTGADKKTGSDQKKESDQRTGST
jgi:hypothetical protein